MTFGYHGASRETCESIGKFFSFFLNIILLFINENLKVDNGLLCPGEFTKTGQYIDVYHGALYGKGIYVSKDLCKASYYSYGSSTL